MPSLHVFDAYGTLFDLQAGVIRLRGVLGPATDRLAELWRSKQLEYTWVRALMGRPARFWDLTEAALDFAAARCGGLDPDIRRKLLDGYRDIDAFPDARPALARLRSEGSRTAILSNGDADMLERAAGAAGLAPHLDAILSVEPLRTFKTDPRTYALVGERFGVPPGAVTFVSSNRWDVAGAAAYGFNAVWLNRARLPDEYADLAPGRVIAGLDELVAPAGAPPPRGDAQD